VLKSLFKHKFWALLLLVAFQGQNFCDYPNSFSLGVLFCKAWLCSELLLCNDFKVAWKYSMTSVLYSTVVIIRTTFYNILELSAFCLQKLFLTVFTINTDLFPKQHQLIDRSNGQAVFFSLWDGTFKHNLGEFQPLKRKPCFRVACSVLQIQLHILMLQKVTVHHVPIFYLPSRLWSYTSEPLHPISTCFARL
jgi:hypothetical protein